MSHYLPIPTDEEILQSRVESYERILNRLIARFQALAQSPSSEKNDLEAAHIILSLEIDSFVQSLRKSRGGHGLRNVSIQDVESFGREIERIGAEKAAMQQSIDNLQQQLLKAEEERRNKIEYDGLAKTINKIPSRSSNLETIDRLRSEIESLHSERKRYTETWTTRRKAFDDIVSNLENLGQLVRDEKAEQERRQALDDDDVEEEGAVNENNNGNNNNNNDRSKEKEEGEQDEDEDEEEGAIGESNREQGETRRTSENNEDHNDGLNPDARPFLPNVAARLAEQSPLPTSTAPTTPHTDAMDVDEREQNS